MNIMRVYEQNERAKLFLANQSKKNSLNWKTVNSLASLYCIMCDVCTCVVYICICDIMAHGIANKKAFCCDSYQCSQLSNEML